MSFQILTPSYHHGYDGSAVPLPKSDEIILYDSRLEVGLVDCDKGQINLSIGPFFGVSFVGDVRLVVYKVQNNSPKKAFQSWINSAFLMNNELIRPKRELDGAVKDKKNKKFHRDFYIRCIFDDMYVEDESNEDSKDNSVVDVNTKGPLKEEDEQIDEDATEIEEAYKVDEDATEIEDAYKIDEDATDAEDANEIDDGKTEGIPDENEEIQTPFFDLEGEHKEEHGHLGGDALVQQFLNRMNVGDVEENDSTEEENKVRSSYESNASTMENGITTNYIPPPPPPPPTSQKTYSALVEDSKEAKVLSLTSGNGLLKRKNHPGKSLGLEHLAADIQFCTSPISTSTHKFNSSWNALAGTDEDLRKSLREASTILVRRRISKGSSHIRQAMLTSENDDDIWLAKQNLISNATWK